MGCAKRSVLPCHRQIGPSTTVPSLPPAPPLARKCSPPRGRRDGRCLSTTRYGLRWRTWAKILLLTERNAFLMRISRAGVLLPATCSRLGTPFTRVNEGMSRRLHAAGGTADARVRWESGRQRKAAGIERRASRGPAGRAGGGRRDGRRRASWDLRARGQRRPDLCQCRGQRLAALRRYLLHVAADRLYFRLGI